MVRPRHLLVLHATRHGLRSLENMPQRRLMSAKEQQADVDATCSERRFRARNGLVLRISLALAVPLMREEGTGSRYTQQEDRTFLFAAMNDRARRSHCGN